MRDPQLVNHIRYHKRDGKCGDCPGCGFFLTPYRHPKYCGNCGTPLQWAAGAEVVRGGE